MLDNMTKQQLIEEGLLKESGWTIFQKWKKDFLKANPQLKLEAKSVRKNVYEQAIKDMKIPVRMNKIFHWVILLSKKATSLVAFYVFLIIYYEKYKLMIMNQIQNY